MSISCEVRSLARKRANFSCEYCGVSEADVGGELTIDHFRPPAFGGTDEIENLVYCCPRCNLYKHDYWPTRHNQCALLNPRAASYSQHFEVGVDGTLIAMTPDANFAIKLLHLNRPQLLIFRQRKAVQEHREWLIMQLDELNHSLEQLLRQDSVLRHDQQMQLERYRTLLRALF